MVVGISTSSSSSGAPPPWVTTAWDATLWFQPLKDQGVDMLAIQQVYLLAQLGEAGAFAANNVVHKVLKKAADREQVANISGFVHTCCLKARRQIEGNY